MNFTQTKTGNKKLSVIVISITPFDKDGKLDENEFRRQLRRLRDAGCSVYVGGSATSEGYALTPAELDCCLGIAVEELKGKVSVRAMGCEPRLPSQMVAFMRQVEKFDVDAAQIFSMDTGHGAKPSVQEMEKYYRTVIESTSLKVSLSSHRSMGYFLPPDMIERLVDLYPNNIVGVHYGGSEMGYLAELIRRVGDRIDVHCAGPENALNVFGLNGNGFMGPEGNFFPPLVASIISAWQANDRDKLRLSFDQVVAFRQILRRYGSSRRALKPLMSAFGYPGGTLREPWLPVNDDQLKELVKAVVALKIPGVEPPQGFQA